MKNVLFDALCESVALVNIHFGRSDTWNVIFREKGIATEFNETLTFEQFKSNENTKYLVDMMLRTLFDQMNVAMYERKKAVCTCSDKTTRTTVVKGSDATVVPKNPWWRGWW